MSNRPTRPLLRSNRYHAFQKSHYPIALSACQIHSMKYTKILILIEELDRVYKDKKKSNYFFCVLHFPKCRIMQKKK